MSHTNTLAGIVKEAGRNATAVFDKTLYREWLKKHNLSEYVSKVTAEKPRALCYIDDKSVKFDGDWNKLEKEIYNFGVKINE